MLGFIGVFIGLLTVSDIHVVHKDGGDVPQLVVMPSSRAYNEGEDEDEHISG
jgi:hypothetical protein